MTTNPGFMMTREQFMAAVAKQFDARFGPDGMPADISAAVAAQADTTPPAPTPAQAGTPEYAKACRDAFMAGPGSMAPERHESEPAPTPETVERMGQYIGHPAGTSDDVADAAALAADVRSIRKALKQIEERIARLVP